MDATPAPPPYAQLIRRRREAYPEMSMAAAARAAEALIGALSLNYQMSRSTWEQIENGNRMEKDQDGRSFRRQRGAKPGTIAIMACVVGVTPGELTEAGGEKGLAAAGILAALLADLKKRGQPDTSDQEVAGREIAQSAGGADEDAFDRLEAQAAELAELARRLRARQAGRTEGRSAAS